MTQATSITVRPSRQVRQRTARDRAQLSAEAAQYVAERVGESVVLEECARAIYSSPRHLQRALADQGTSWRRLLLLTRMQVAAQRLADQRWTVGRIARSVGYQEPGQFAKAFRRVYGMNPSEYRARTEGPEHVMLERRG
jgi:AraC family transcriptional regulator of adaptative response / methylphosphotriester-DNA alkyltransferase methyltransferase